MCPGILLLSDFMAHNGEQFPIFVSFVHVEASFDVDVSEEEKKRIIEKNMFFFV